MLKTRSILLFILVFLSTPGCEKIMHPEEISIGKIEDYGSLVSATEGVYGILANFMGYKGAYQQNVKADDINIWWEEYNEYYHTYRGSSNNTIDPYIDWLPLYQAVTSANNIICQFESVKDLNEEFSRLLGEVYLIRAYCYFRLTRSHGQIPLISDIEINYDVPRSGFPEIYAFIEKDLITAMELLPPNISSSRIPYVTPHRGSAKAILAEVYLSQAGYPCNDFQKYELAAKEAGELIDSADYFGLGLADDFAFLWDSAHYYNSETVFALYYSKPIKYSIQMFSNFLYFGYHSSYNTKIGFEENNMNDLSLDFFCSESKFFNDYPQSYRKEITFFETIYVPGRYKTNNPEIDTGIIHIDKVSTSTHIAYRKFYYSHSDFEISSEPGYSTYYLYGQSRIYLFRYAQTMLTCAEALARSGHLNSKAYECINQIRRRAHGLDLYTPSVFDLQPGLSPETFADSVVWERAWELCGEPEGRWFDLVRLEKVEDLKSLRFTTEGGPPNAFNKSVYFFPIPPTDTLLNPNLGN
jgi:starch-binding outer membrane protein, SusD/RagB family